jgi:hypothetical protein
MLDDQDKVRRHERKHVKITGAVDAASSMIHVETIEQIVLMRFSRRDLNMHTENRELPTRSADLCERDIGMSLDSTGLPYRHAARSPGSCHAGTRPPAGTARALEFF